MHFHLTQDCDETMPIVYLQYVFKLQSIIAFYYCYQL